MTATLIEQPPRELAPAGRYPGTVLAGKVARHAARSGALWGLIFGLFIFLQTHAYTSTYKTQASRDQLARSYGSNMAMNALLGSERAVNTVAGFAYVAFRRHLERSRIDLGSAHGHPSHARRGGSRALRSAPGRSDHT